MEFHHKKLARLKRLCTGFLALATVVTALPTTPVHAESKQYWTESTERVGIVEKVMNDGSIGSTFNEGHLTVEGEDAYCIDINTNFCLLSAWTGVVGKAVTTVARAKKPVHNRFNIFFIKSNAPFILGIKIDAHF